MKFKESRSLVKYYRPAKFEKDRMINNREIAECAFLSSVTLWPWPLHPEKNTALLLVIIYQLAKYEKDLTKNSKEIAEHRKWEENKIRKKRQYNNRKVFRPCRQTLTMNCIFRQLYMYARL